MGWIRTWCAYLGLGQGFNESRVVEDVSLALAQQLEDLALDPVQLDVHCRAVNHQLFLKFGAIVGERKTAAGCLSQAREFRQVRASTPIIAKT